MNMMIMMMMMMMMTVVTSLHSTKKIVICKGKNCVFCELELNIYI